jgi:hypothetical protein
MLLALAFIAFGALVVAWAWLPASTGQEPEAVQPSSLNDMPTTEAA